MQPQEWYKFDLRIYYLNQWAHAFRLLFKEIYDSTIDFVRLVHAFYILEN